MSLFVFIALALAGGFGASARMLLDGIIKAHTTSATPWGTIIINLSGSLALGLITGLASSQILPEAWHLVIGAGFLGGYTTFSTASFETVRLIQERRWVTSLVNSLGTLALATGAAGAGLWAGGLF